MPEEARVPEGPPVIAVCGKGGVGKTVVSALVARGLVYGGVAPLLVVDADPVGGLAGAMGLAPERTLGQVRRSIIDGARGSGEAGRQSLADQLDYLVLEALIERDDHALLAMGRTSDPGCFCPVNALLRHAIALLSSGFAAVLVDAEAGIEQIQREVTRRVDRTLVVVDGSRRSLETLEAIRALVPHEQVAVVGNRLSPEEAREVGLTSSGHESLAGLLPEDEEVRRFDRQGRSLWELPEGNPAVRAALELAGALVPGAGRPRPGIEARPGSAPEARR